MDGERMRTRKAAKKWFGDVGFGHLPGFFDVAQKPSSVEAGGKSIKLAAGGKK